MKSIESINLYRLELPLKVPYKLAFGPVTHFDTLIVSVTDANGNQIGQTLHTCQNPTHYDPSNVACIYPPYYTGSSFTASNGKIYFGGGTPSRLQIADLRF